MSKEYCIVIVEMQEWNKNKCIIKNWFSKNIIGKKIGMQKQQ